MEIALFLISPTEVVNSKSRKKLRKILVGKGNIRQRSAKISPCRCKKKGEADWLEGLNGRKEKGCFGAIGWLGGFFGLRAFWRLQKPSETA